MKILLPILGVFVLLGAIYGLAFMGVIPVQKMAAKNPALAKALAAVHLAPAKPKNAVKPAAPAQPNAQTQALQAQEQQIAADRDQLEKEKVAFEDEKQRASAPSPAADGSTPDAATGTTNTSAKLSAIYATMSPDDIAKIFAKLPDPVVIQNLMPLDEEKAGKVLAAMPAARAARLSQLMMAKGPAQLSTSAPTSPQPQTHLP